MRYKTNLTKNASYKRTLAAIRKPSGFGIGYFCLANKKSPHHDQPGERQSIVAADRIE